VPGLVERVVRREPIVSDGKSGSLLERGRLDDGTSVVVKHADRRRDWIMQATGDEGRIASLWAGGIFERLPASIDHVLLDVEPVPGGAVVVMRDVSAALLADGRGLRAAHRQVLGAAADLHRAFAGEPVGTELCDLSDYYAFLSPVVCERFAPDHDVPRLAVEGWGRFHSLVPADVSEVIAAVHADPGRLAGALLNRVSTLVHGDLKLANLGLADDRVIALDWGTLTTWAPPAVEYAWYLAINGAALAESHDDLLAQARGASDDRDDTAWALALLGGLAQLGWEKALGATGDDPVTRARETEGLRWWSRQARAAAFG
jgi:hypothetical protein